jgi:hypothetical protein
MMGPARRNLGVGGDRLLRSLEPGAQFRRTQPVTKAVEYWVLHLVKRGAGARETVDIDVTRRR